MHSPASAPSAQVSFEHMLGWFGRFTPQFKLRLMMLRRQMSAEDFDNRMREIFALYRMYFIAFASVRPGAARAKEAFSLMDEEIAMIDKTNIKCGKGCAACCRLFPKQITADEAAVLAEAIHNGDVQIDITGLEPGTKACLFLSDEGSCKVYSIRPGVCRKTHVTSSPAECEKIEGNVVPQIDLMPEMILSALMSLPDASIGSMPEMVSAALKALQADHSVKEIRFQLPPDLSLIETSPESPEGAD